MNNAAVVFWLSMIFITGCGLPSYDCYDNVCIDVRIEDPDDLVAEFLGHKKILTGQVLWNVSESWDRLDGLQIKITPKLNALGMYDPKNHTIALLYDEEWLPTYSLLQVYGNELCKCLAWQNGHKEEVYNNQTDAGWTGWVGDCWNEAETTAVQMMSVE